MFILFCKHLKQNKAGNLNWDKCDFFMYEVVLSKLTNFLLAKKLNFICNEFKFLRKGFLVKDMPFLDNYFSKQTVFFESRPFNIFSLFIFKLFQRSTCNGLLTTQWLQKCINTFSKKCINTFSKGLFLALMWKNLKRKGRIYKSYVADSLLVRVSRV